jgi:hypothetical protein
VAWEVEFSDEFGEWRDSLTAAEQKSVDFTVSFLQECGPALRMPHSSGVETSRRPRMSELRIQHEGRPYRAMPLIGGHKTGNNRWYEEYVPVADAIYDRHLRELEEDWTAVSKSGVATGGIK